MNTSQEGHAVGLSPVPQPMLGQCRPFLRVSVVPAASARALASTCKHCSAASQAPSPALLFRSLLIWASPKAAQHCHCSGGGQASITEGSLAGEWLLLLQQQGNGSSVTCESPVLHGWGRIRSHDISEGISVSSLSPVMVTAG